MKTGLLLPSYPQNPGAAFPMPSTSQVSFRQALDELLRQQARPIDKFGHQPRLYALARLAGRDTSYDDDVVFAAAYLHDLGVFIGNRPENPELLQGWDHVKYAVEVAPDLLRGANFPEEKIPAVLRAIETHQPKDTPESNEAMVLRDADILEQLGSIAVLRAVAKTGRDTRYATFTPVIAFLEKSLRELPAAILLPVTRELARPKIEILRLFLEAVRAESYDCLF